MEEDIKLLEKLEFIAYGKKEDIEALGMNINIEKLDTTKIIRNLINKYKEQEKMIELMANDLYELYKQYPGTIDKFYKHKICLFDDCDNINREVNCDYCFKDYFKKKARTSNDK